MNEYQIKRTIVALEKVFPNAEIFRGVIHNFEGKGKNVEVVHVMRKGKKTQTYSAMGIRIS